ncbi:MAG: 50S ribosome-binding GTPase [Phycisphaerae bacterium]|nr:50S ribosome-binding GTPase [Phycisphaerae bacterium]
MKATTPTGSAAGAANECPPPAETLHAFLREMIGRYGRLRDARNPALPAPAEIDERLTELLLAAIVVRHACGGTHNWPRQLAVMGPTQTGKSTVVNLLLGQQVAEVSPLAGFTVHAQGFWRVDALPRNDPRGSGTTPPETLFELAEAERPRDPVAAHDPRWAEDLFPRWHRYEPRALARDELNAYALTILESPLPPPGEQAPGRLSPCVVWDTPDFDSLAAREYREGLLNVIGAADAYMLVVSKEKYSDLSVWRLLELLEPLRRPLVICVNKMTSDASEAIVASLHQRLAERGTGWGDVPIVTIAHDGVLDAGAPATPETRMLRLAAADCLARASREHWTAGTRTLLRRHWETWTTPIAHEHAALQAYEALAAESVAGLLHAYQRDYLNHPQRYDSFRRATIELLQLLEIPGVGHALGQIRQVVTWPARRLWHAGRRLLNTQQRAGGGTLPSELAFLHSEFDTLLGVLRRDVARRIDPTRPDCGVWRALDHRLETEQPNLLAAFRRAADQHHEQVQHEVHAAAGHLFELLKDRPKLLNTLRGARVTADAASVVLAIKTGGIAAHDVLLAPALFGLTSLLTEGALGTYMKSVAEGLKERQYEHARSELAAGVLREELLRIATELDDDTLFGIAPQRLTSARQALEAWTTET